MFVAGGVNGGLPLSRCFRGQEQNAHTPTPGTETGRVSHWGGCRNRLLLAADRSFSAKRIAITLGRGEAGVRTGGNTVPVEELNFRWGPGAGITSPLAWSRRGWERGLGYDYSVCHRILLIGAQFVRGVIG